MRYRLAQWLRRLADRVDPVEPIATVQFSRELTPEIALAALREADERVKALKENKP